MKISRLLPFIAVGFALSACAPSDLLDGKDKNIRAEKLTGVEAPRDMMMTDLPPGSYIEFKSPMGISLHLLSRDSSNGQATGYFQKGGFQGYGPGTPEWSAQTPPSVDVDFHTCAVVMDLDKVNRLERDGRSTLSSMQGSQWPLRFAGNSTDTRGRSTFRFDITGVDSGVQQLKCDLMTVNELVHNVFGDQFEVYIPEL